MKLHFKGLITLAAISIAAKYFTASNVENSLLEKNQKNSTSLYSNEDQNNSIADSSKSKNQTLTNQSSHSPNALIYSPFSSQKRDMSNSKHSAEVAKENEARENQTSEFETNDDDSSDVADEINNAQSAYDTWKEERINFYREDLELDTPAIEWLGKLEESAAQEIQNLVKMMENGDPSVTDANLHQAYSKILDSYETDVSKILGDEKLEKLKKFRDNYNSEISSRFDSRGKIVGF